MVFCGKHLPALFLAVGLCAAASAAEYTGGRAGYSELPPVQSYNPDTGETVSLEPLDNTENAPAPASLSGTRMFESQPIAFPDAQRRVRAEGEDGGRRQVTMPSIWPALLSVLAVCGLFCAALYLMKKYMPGHRQLFNHPAIEVLGRTHLDQKRFVSLVRVGKRVVVVGVSPDDMRPLSEITDEAEVTEILDQARPKTEAGLSLFQKLFKKNVIDSEAAEAREMADLKAEELKEQMLALKNRVAAIAPKRERESHFDAVG